MTEFPIVQINGYANVQSGYSFKSSDWLDDGVPVVKIANVKDGRVDRTGLGFVSETVAAQAAKFSLSEGDVLLAMTGYVGEMAVVKESDLPLLLNQRVGRCLPVSPLLDKRFMYYALSSSNGRLQLENLGQGSAQANLSAGDFGLVEIPLPPLAEQREIASVLGALDDKIKSNRRRSLIAMELYQTEIRDMLLKLPDNGLGSLQQLSTFMSRSSERIGDVYAPEFSATVTGLEPRSSRFKKTLSAGNQKNKKIQTGDLVFGFSRRTLSFGVMRDPIGSVSPVYEVFSVHGGLEIAGLIEMQIRDRMHDFMDIVKPGAREGQPIEAKYLLNKKLVLPHNPDGFMISEQIKNLFRVVELSVSENRKLTMLRDTLLPELLSGRLRVKDAESMMDNV